MSMEYDMKPVSGLAGWLIKIGLAKDEKGANNIMIVFVIIGFAYTIYSLVG